MIACQSPKPVQADANSRFSDLPQMRATARNKPTPGIRLTATPLNSTPEQAQAQAQAQAQESTYGPYFEDEHGTPSAPWPSCLPTPQASSPSRSSSPTSTPGTTRSASPPEGVTLDIPLTVAAIATDGPAA